MDADTSVLGFAAIHLFEPRFLEFAPIFAPKAELSSELSVSVRSTMFTMPSAKNAMRLTYAGDYIFQRLRCSTMHFRRDPRCTIITIHDAHDELCPRCRTFQNREVHD